MIANISYHLRSANFSLLHIVRSFGLDAFASAIEKQMETPNTTSDALKLCLLSLLLQDVDRDEERQIKLVHYFSFMFVFNVFLQAKPATSKDTRSSSATGAALAAGVLFNVFYEQRIFWRRAFLVRGKNCG